MDPLSTFASAVAVIQLGERIAHVCKSYIDNVRDYPKELRMFFIEIQSLVIVFQALKVLENGDDEDSSIISRIGGPHGPVRGSQEAIEALHSLLPAPAAPEPNGKSRKRRTLLSALETLAWPLKAEKARKLRDDLMRYKSTISMAIGGSLLLDLQSIKKTLSESQAREVCQWFQHTNPSSNHNAATALYENGTGTWVLRCEKWANWLNLKTRCLWIHGIPGAGKTVLAAYLIEQVRLACETETCPKSDYVYYYCYHGHNQDEAVPFLRWIISQLCRRTTDIPAEAYATFQRGQEPSLKDLFRILQAILSNFRTVFIVVDALDESQPRENLLKVIEDLMSDHRFNNVQLLVTSREYKDIENTVATISDRISMSNPLVEADIKLYVEVRTKAEPRFQTWPQTLQEEVERSLSKGAKGMFRWAVCQIDILRRLRHMDKIKAALRDLPKGLDETYERIFSLIPAEDRELVQYALHWLCFRDVLWGTKSDTPSMCLLLDSYFYSRSQRRPSREVDHHFINAAALRESCGCLLSYTESYWEDELETGLRLSHYTVREFLESSRTTTPGAEFFKIVPGTSYEAACATIFRGALEAETIHDTHIDFRQSRAKFDEDCLFSASRALEKTEEFVQLDLAVKFLDHSKRHYEAFKSNELYSRLSEITIQDCGDNMTVAILVRLLHLGSFRLARELLGFLDPRLILADLEIYIDCVSYLSMEGISWEFTGSVLELFACHPVENGAFRFLLDHLLEHISDGIDYTRLLHLHTSNHILACTEHDQESERECVLTILLRKGASPRLRSCQITPLQMAVGCRDIVAVRLLLEAQADPNDSGDPDNTEWDDDGHLGDFTRFSGCSPLFILRHLPLVHYSDVSTERRASLDDIEELLLTFGAEETLSYETQSSKSVVGPSPVSNASDISWQVAQ